MKCKTKQILTAILALTILTFLVTNAYAHTITVPTNAYFGFGNGYYIHFNPATTLSTAYRQNNYWYFNGHELSIQNTNLTVNTFFLNKVFIGIASGSTDALAVLTVKKSDATLPYTITVNGYVPKQVSTLGQFNGEAENCMFTDSTSKRVYVKAKLESTATIRVDWNPTTSETPVTGVNPTITVSDAHATLTPTETATVYLAVNFNYISQVTLTDISFEGNQASWIQTNFTLPLTVTFWKNTVPIKISVPQNANEGSYNVKATLNFQHSYGTSICKATVWIDVSTQPPTQMDTKTIMVAVLIIAFIAVAAAGSRRR